MSSKAKEIPANEAPSATTDAPSTAEGAPSDAPAKGAALKKKFQDLIAGLKAGTSGKLKGVAKPNFKGFFQSLGSGSVFILKEIVFIPRWIFSEDGINRVAALGFLASLTLFVITAPQVFLLLVKKPSLKGPPAVVAVEPQQQGSQQLDAVVFLGPFKAALVELEAFAECQDDQTAERLKGLLPKVQEVVTSLVQDQTEATLGASEAKQELAAKMRQSMNSVLGNDGIKSVIITKFTVKNKL